MKNNLLKVFTVLFAALLTGMSVKADEITYNGTEKMYFSSKQLNWGTIWAGDCDLFLLFNNSTRSSVATWQETSDNNNGILVVTVPAGTWNRVRVLRTQKTDHNNIFNQSDDYTLQTGKNYLTDNGGSWEVYGGGTEPTTFTKGSTLYFDMNGQDWTGGHYGAIFYTSTMHNINGNDDGYWDDEHISQRGSKYTISQKSTVLTEVGNGVYSLTIPYDNATTVRVCRFNKESDTQGYLKSCSKRLAAKDLGTNNCLKLLAGGKEGTWNLNAEWSTYAEPTPALTDEFYIFGDGGCADWVKGWSGNKGKAEYKMTVNGSVASITFYNMKKQNGYLFKVWNKTKNTELTWAAYDGSKSTDITCTNPSGTNNISFNLDANADITVYTDGTKVWAKAEKHQTISSDYVLVGDFQNWTNNADAQKLTKVDNYTQTYTVTINPTASYCNNNIARFKIVPYGSWDNQIYLENVDDASSDYVKAPQSKDWGDNAGSDHRILVQFAKQSDVTFTLWKDKNGNKKVTIKVVESTEPEPDPSLQPWSGDSYKEWYLTGDFTKPDGSFDGWTMNPSDYKFVADGDNYQKMSITLDPNDPNNNEKIFHNYNNKKLTRFEIIRKGTWDDPRINKPQFDTQSSNCSLQTDWKDGGSNRMSLELTTKSVIEFKIWRWGTSASNAERKVTVTITPIEQVTVNFMANGEVFDTQTIEKGGKPTKPATNPTKEGFKFLGWSETEGGDVVDVTTIVITEAKTFYAKWEKKSIESLTLSQTEGKIFVNGSDLTLIATVTPEDVLLASTEWTSTDDNIATVTDGVVHPVAVGEVTITCTVTDEKGNVLTATCAITVRPEDEDCEMVRTDVYAATITSDEDKDEAEVTGGTLTVKDMYHVTGEPFTMLFVKEGSYTSSDPYGVDNGSGVLMGDDNPSNGIENWIRIKCGQKNGKDVYYIQNAATKKYLAITGDVLPSPTANPDWLYYVTTLTNAPEGADTYKWLFLQDGSGRMNIVNAFEFNGKTSDSDLKYFYHLHTNNWLEPGSYASCAPKAIVCGRSCDMGRNCVRPKTVSIITTPLPDYKTTSVTVDDVTYYRMTEKTVITAAMTTAIARGNKVQIALYNDKEENATVIVKDNAANTIATIEVPAKQAVTTDYEAKDNDWEGAQELVITADADMCIAAIDVVELHPDPVHDAMLHWDTTDDLTQGVTLALGATVQYEATAKGSGEITYESTDTEVATVSENGTITTIAAGTTTIKAMLAAEACFGAGEITYTLTVNDATLQQLIDATLAGETLTLTIDYTGQDGVINKAITIKGENKEVGTLTVTESGSLTVGSAINMNEFTLWEAEGNAATPATSAQIIGAEQLNISGDTWFNVTFEPGANIDFGWYTLAVPFTVDNANGVYYINAEGSRTHATCGSDYMIYNYNSSKRAQGQNGWEKYYGNLQPGVLYLITLNDDLQVSTFSFKKASGNLGGNAELALNAYPSSDPTNANWNGVGNSTLVYRNVSFSGDKVQVYNHAADAFQVYLTSDVSFVVGGAFFVQSEGAETLTLTETANPGLLRTPIRERAATMAELNVRIGADENSFTDQIFLSAEDDAEESYEIGHDLVKMSHNTPKVAQLAINAYGVALCDAELPWNASNEAVFPLTITAPKAGTYTIYLNGTAQSALLLYQNGHYVCDLTAGAYTMDLGKGKNNEYSLVMTRPNETVITGNEDVQQALNVKKIILDNQMYILKDNQMINAIGTIVK